MQEVFNWILDHWGVTVFLLGIIIQFTPAIKWNPFTSFFGWLGRVINKPLSDRLDVIEKNLEDVKARQLTDEKDRIRFEVLDFANSCRNNIKHTRDEFQHIIDVNDKYEELLRQTNDTNGVFKEEYQYILKVYHSCQEKNNFLA